MNSVLEGPWWEQLHWEARDYEGWVDEELAKSIDIQHDPCHLITYTKDWREMPED